MQPRVIAEHRSFQQVSVFVTVSYCLQENGDTFEALKTMSAYFLRADAHAICGCIQAFHLNDLLFSVVHLDGLFACWQDPSIGRRTSMDPGMTCPITSAADASAAAMDGVMPRPVSQ